MTSYWLMKSLEAGKAFSRDDASLLPRHWHDNTSHAETITSSKIPLKVGVGKVLIFISFVIKQRTHAPSMLPVPQNALNAGPCM